MTAPQVTTQTAKTIRLIHAAMITGVLLFAIVGHFVMMPSMAPTASLSPAVITALLAVSLVLCIAALFARNLVPRRTSDESPDSFWARASQKAMITWALVEGASLLPVFLHSSTGAKPPIAVAGIAVLLFAFLNPGYFERR